MSESLQIAKRVLITSWVVTVTCILLYVGIGTYASVVLGYDSSDALGFAPTWIRGCVYFACTCGFIGIFAGAPVAIISTVIYFIQRKKIKLFFMFMSEVNDLGCLKAAKAAAELAIKARWEARSQARIKRQVRSGRVGPNIQSIHEGFYSFFS